MGGVPYRFFMLSLPALEQREDFFPAPDVIGSGLCGRNDLEKSGDDVRVSNSFAIRECYCVAGDKGKGGRVKQRCEEDKGIEYLGKHNMIDTW